MNSRAIRVFTYSVLVITFWLAASTIWGIDTVLLDSSWRPEDTQDGEITVSFDGGKEEQILLFESVGIDAGAHTLVTIPTFKEKEEKINDGEQINETLEIPIDNPTGAAEMIISFGVIDAQNDWWWAIDNIKLISTAFDVEPRDKLAVKWAEIKALQ